MSGRPYPTMVTSLLVSKNNYFPLSIPYFFLVANHSLNAVGILLQTPLLRVCVTLVWLKDLTDWFAGCNCWTKLLDPSGSSSSVSVTVPLSYLSGDRLLCVQELTVSVGWPQDPGSNSSLSLCRLNISFPRRALAAWASDLQLKTSGATGQT